MLAIVVEEREGISISLLVVREGVSREDNSFNNEGPSLVDEVIRGSKL